METTVISMANTRKRPFHKRMGFRKSMQFYLAVAPWLIGFVLMTLVPLVIGLLTSFTNYDGLGIGLKWVGWFNYKWLFTMDHDAWWGLYRTGLITIVGVPLGTIGGFALATLLNQKVKAMGFFRTAFYIPSIIPVVVTALMFRFIYDRDGGPLNALISLFAPGRALAWLSNDLCTPALTKPRLRSTPSKRGLLSSSTENSMNSVPKYFERVGNAGSDLYVTPVRMRSSSMR